MELKKSTKADLERKKPIYLQVGLVLALSFALFAFEYKSYDKVAEEETTATTQEVIDEIVIQTKQETKPEPPPPAQLQTTLIQIVDNNVQVNSDIEISQEDDGSRNQVYQEIIEAAPVEAEEAEIFTVVEETPEYPGGDEARMKYLRDNLKYPQLARESGIDGTVYIEFVIETNGNITKAVIKRDIGGGCGEEALRVVKGMPRWKPGKQRNKPVRTQFVLPIKFILS